MLLLFVLSPKQRLLDERTADTTSSVTRGGTAHDMHIKYLASVVRLARVSAGKLDQSPDKLCTTSDRLSKQVSCHSCHFVIQDKPRHSRRSPHRGGVSSDGAASAAPSAPSIFFHVSTTNLGGTLTAAVPHSMFPCVDVKLRAQLHAHTVIFLKPCAVAYAVVRSRQGFNELLVFTHAAHNGRKPPTRLGSLPLQKESSRAEWGTTG